MNQVPYLEFCGISKEFPGVKALQNVSLRLPAGHGTRADGRTGPTSPPAQDPERF